MFDTDFSTDKDGNKTVLVALPGERDFFFPSSAWNKLLDALKTVSNAEQVPDSVEEGKFEIEIG
jgi:hypothetical protein